QLAKFLAIRDRLPALKAIVLMHGDVQSRGVYTWTKFLELGLNTPEQELDKRVAAQSPDAMATLIYTSGTTGTPNGVMLSHDNLTWTAQTAVGMIGAKPGEQILS